MWRKGVRVVEDGRGGDPPAPRRGGTKEPERGGVLFSGCIHHDVTLQNKIFHSLLLFFINNPYFTDPYLIIKCVGSVARKLVNYSCLIIRGPGVDGSAS